MTTTINVPASSGGAPIIIVEPTAAGGSPVVVVEPGTASTVPDVTIPTARGSVGPPGTRSTDIGFSFPGEVPAEIGVFAVTVPTTVKPDLCLAEATGTGTVAFAVGATPIGSVAFPGAVFTFVASVMARGFLSFTSTGSLSDLSLAIAGERS